MANENTPGISSEHVPIRDVQEKAIKLLKQHGGERFWSNLYAGLTRLDEQFPDFSLDAAPPGRIDATTMVGEMCLVQVTGAYAGQKAGAASSRSPVSSG